MNYTGIAFCGKKGAGKDMLIDWLVEKTGTPPDESPVLVVRCKAPIVEQFVRFFGSYMKGEDDRLLMNFSKFIREYIPNLVPDYLKDLITQCSQQNVTVLVPDMRRVPDAEVLKELGLMCIKVEASESTRLDRICRRGDIVGNYDPLDITETDVDLIECPFMVNNDQDDGGLFAIEQMMQLYSIFKSPIRG